MASPGWGSEDEEVVPRRSHEGSPYSVISVLAALAGWFLFFPATAFPTLLLSLYDAPRLDMPLATLIIAVQVLCGLFEVAAVVFGFLAFRAGEPGRPLAIVGVGLSVLFIFAVIGVLGEGLRLAGERYSP